MEPKLFYVLPKQQKAFEDTSLQMFEIFFFLKTLIGLFSNRASARS